MHVKKAEDDTKGKERKLPKQVWDCNLMTSETKVTNERICEAFKPHAALQTEQ